MACECGLCERLEALRDEWMSEPVSSALLNNQAAVRVMHVLADVDKVL